MGEGIWKAMALHIAVPMNRMSHLCCLPGSKARELFCSDQVLGMHDRGKLPAALQQPESGAWPIA